jgi:hypothetical protein
MVSAVLGVAVGCGGSRDDGAAPDGATAQRGPDASRGDARVLGEAASSSSHAGSSQMPDGSWTTAEASTSGPTDARRSIEAAMEPPDSGYTASELCGTPCPAGFCLVKLGEDGGISQHQCIATPHTGCSMGASGWVNSYCGTAPTILCVFDEFYGDLILVECGP